ncbi:NitT/TauT family transport system ATP-binding protein OS=Bosea thiooxidans OX=53254 GN=SAMN05660750_02936 PE=4 SV=1 [Bosea thiooxidans]|uniref:NitT/TauT family transport system ATP-binding protein n=2 Tax=Bosea thiooxidans TaxID=53254 RepID=A0A1T5F2S9_9HYPH|nr:ABC transporter ATP-binding protein [Bosea thiooxidans]SKB90514.1 NitT/TauT family transport system ATP-binding protein [Bosea thiooxidans]
MDARHKGEHDGVGDRMTAVTTAPPLVELRQVSLAYGSGPSRLQALEDATFSIAKGEFIAVVGPSGCGKSTLMKLVTGLLPPSGGEVRVHGQVVKGPIRGVGMAFQAPTLMPWRTTLDNILLPLEVVEPHKRRFRSNKAEYIARGEALLASVGLGGFGQKYPWQLSGGMQQRSSLCRALVHEPDILMLDEPFGALDAFTREELWSVMQKLWMERRFTAVLVTHDLREAVYLADTVYVMSRRPGKIVKIRKVELPRPRTLETTFSVEFVDIVHELRERIHMEHA